jgi:PKD repeat protein
MRAPKTITIMKIAVLLHGLLLLSSSQLPAENAPVTFAANITNAIPGTSSVPVPVKVTGFTDIAKFTLTMKFDTTRVRFVSATTNPLLPGMTVTYTKPAGGFLLGKLVLSWTNSSNFSLADSSTLADLVFSYTTGTGLLTWYFVGGEINEYKRYIAGTLTKLNDDPKYQYYKNGGISNRAAPVTTISTVTNAVPGQVSVPITANNFTDIGSCSLNFDYVSTGLTFTQGTASSSLPGASIGDSDLGNGKHRVTFGWYGASGVTLANGSVIMTIKFTYINGNTPLEFYDDSESCEFTDEVGDVLIDLPTASYYHNGGVTPPLVAGFSADNLTPGKNQTVVFTDLTTGYPTAWNWSFDRPGNVVFVNSTNSASQNPQVQFTDGGLYSATLVASNQFTSDNEVKTNYIRVGIPGKWTGNTSTDWNTTTNWENWQVPGSSTDVVIPSSAPNWPVVGQLTLGVHCHNLTLSGTTSKLTVTEDFIIHP